MKKAILVSVVTLILAMLIEVNLGGSDRLNLPGIGIMFAVVVMGGFILADINKKEIDGFGVIEAVIRLWVGGIMTRKVPL